MRSGTALDLHVLIISNTVSGKDLALLVRFEVSDRCLTENVKMVHAVRNACEKAFFLHLFL